MAFGALAYDPMTGRPIKVDEPKPTKFSRKVDGDAPAPFDEPAIGGEPEAGSDHRRWHDLIDKPKGN